ncbi:hypothetical protein HJG60_010464 [Phyllostomus discolor]|uniref:Uncharacterized protein n=1 Tax=Phyllostomus discolor TaxID=89673 RepID=A0A834AL69_9CHIR|nr:hypothetical protein HJG60_010464 [Phyllostomus discolor]
MPVCVGGGVPLNFLKDPKRNVLSGASENSLTEIAFREFYIYTSRGHYVPVKETQCCCLVVALVILDLVFITGISRDLTRFLPSPRSLACHHLRGITCFHPYLEHILLVFSGVTAHLPVLYLGA